jgi:hypothetical protein
MSAWRNMMATGSGVYPGAASHACISQALVVSFYYSPFYITFSDSQSKNYNVKHQKLLWIVESAIY